MNHPFGRPSSSIRTPRDRPVPFHRSIHASKNQPEPNRCVPFGCPETFRRPAGKALHLSGRPRIPDQKHVRNGYFTHSTSSVHGFVQQGFNQRCR